MPKLRARLTTAVLTGATALLLMPAASQASVEFGSPFRNEPTDGCTSTAPCSLLAYESPPADPLGTASTAGSPIDGVVTEFRVKAEAEGEPGTVSFLVGNLTPNNPQKPESAQGSITGSGPTVTIKPFAEPPDEAPVTDIAARVPIKKGQHIGATVTDSIRVIHASSGEMATFDFAPPLTLGGAPRESTEVTEEMLVAAVVEPDADGDGFGDETQDKCPTQAATQGPCVLAAPDTTAPGVSGLGVKNGTISYSLSEAATVSFSLEMKLSGRKVGKKCVKQTAANEKKSKCSTFRAVGGSFPGTGTAGANTAALPNGKSLRPGSYRLTMTARDSAGNQTVTTTSFTIKKKKPKKK